MEDGALAGPASCPPLPHGAPTACACRPSRAGSLTTPGCAEGVVWHMFLQPAHALTLPLVEAYQGEVLLGDIQPLTNRAVQPLNGRAVLLSADPNAPAAAQA